MRDNNCHVFASFLLGCFFFFSVSVQAAPGPLDCYDPSKASTPSCALISSAQAGDLDDVKRALDQGADINVRDAFGSPLLHVLFKHTRIPTPESEALLPKKKKVAHYLIGRGIDVQARDVHEFTALHRAVHDERFNEFIDPLIDKGVDPNLGVGQLQETPLIVAIDGLNHLGMDKLIKRGADVEKHIADQINPLMFAVLKGHIEAVEVLLKHGAKIDAPNSVGITPLGMAVRTGRLMTIDLLVKEGADLDIKAQHDGLSPREYAAKTQHQEIRDAFSKAVAKHRSKSGSKTSKK